MTPGTSAQGERQITRIAPVGVDAIARFFGNQRRGGNDTLQTLHEQPVRQILAPVR